MTSRRRSWHTATHLDGNGFLQAVPALSNGFGADSFVKQVNRRARATTRRRILATRNAPGRQWFSAGFGCGTRHFRGQVFS